MQPDEIRALLRSYRENQSRAAYIETEIDSIRRGIEAENRPEMQAVHAQSYEIPTRTGYSSPTENRALWALDGGKTASAQLWAEEALTLETELWNARRNVAMVDIWLLGLTDKERKVVIAHEIDHLPWYQVAFQSEKLFGHYLTDGALRVIGRQAIDKICRIAR